jgi:outer membrane protein assembly factor BamB
MPNVTNCCFKVNNCCGRLSVVSTISVLIIASAAPRRYNYKTGSQCKVSLGDKPGYISPILINYAGKKMIVNASLGHVFGVDASNGDILWKVKHEQSSGPSLHRWDLIKCTTPLYKDGMVYITGGYDTGGMMVRISADGRGATVAWTDSNLDNHHGGVVLVNGYIYGSNWLNNNDGTGAA